MKAIKLKKKYIKKEFLDDIGVIATGEENGEMYWYHVHDNEIIPDDCTITFHPRKWNV